jgi:endoglucanase
MRPFNNPILTRWMIGIGIGIGVGTWLSIVPAHAESAAAGTEFHRGIAIAHAMAWAPIEPAPSRAFIFPPFADSANSLGGELRALRRTGFDFVRLAVDPGPFLQFQGSRRDGLDRILMARVKSILSSGLSVIVDFHPSDMHEDYRAEVLTRGVGTAAFQDYLRLLGRTAQLLDALQSRRVALEIMNEPPVRPDAWRPMLEAAYTTIRDRAPHLLLVLDGGDAPIPENTKALARFKDDPAILFSFHYYEPYQFTHQGASWMAARYLADVPYPALARSLQDSLDASAATIATADLPLPQKLLAKSDAQQRLESYRSSSFDRTTIARSFDSIANWARDHGVPLKRVILGEFGAMKNDRLVNATRHAERARWFRDVREEAEARGFIWAAWVYREGGGFSLSKNEASTELDPAIVEALGFSR